jgi:hypothetical protein
MVAGCSAGSSAACAWVRLLRPLGAVTVGGSASTVLVLIEVREPEFILAVSNALVSSVANFCVSVDDHAEGNENLPSMFAEARRVVVLRSCILECW